MRILPCSKTWCSCVQLRAGLRYIRLCNEVLVVDDDNRLCGNCVSFVPPDRPLRDIRNFFRHIGLGKTVIDELDLQIHRRTPDDVTRRLAGGQGIDNVIVNVVRIYLGIDGIRTGISARKSANKSTTSESSVVETILSCSLASSAAATCPLVGPISCTC